MTWVWLAGCFAWTFDAVVKFTQHSPQEGELGVVLAVLFLIAWFFFRAQPR